MSATKIRAGLSEEWPAIAQLHSQSWEIAYRDILSNAFLDNHVLANRMQYWETRFKAGIPDHTFIRVAEQGDRLVGLVCAVAGADPVWGTLIDNLHVLPGSQQRGLGRQLIQQAAQWVLGRPDVSVPTEAPMYLWVYRENVRARTFYEKVHGEAVEEKTEPQPDGSMAPIVRYAWFTETAKILAGQ
ncbi:MAG: GNAT family N-acetyltransferase [Bacteroidota bacterium]